MPSSDPYAVDCRALPDSGDPTRVDVTYCCTYVPHCEQELGRCGDGGVIFGCNDPLVPQSQDPALACATVYSIDGWSEYCCAHQTACFPAVLFGCGDAGQSYACTGDATPTQFRLSCSAGYYEDAGTNGTYCCEDDAGKD